MRAVPSEERQAEARQIGARLRWAREAAEMTRPQLANHVGVDHTHIKFLETGIRGPSVYLINSLCLVLDIDPNYLLTGQTDGLPRDLRARLRADHPECGHEPWHPTVRSVATPHYRARKASLA
jgi:transcriptional regulator with XRE-family HTH domain